MAACCKAVGELVAARALAADVWSVTQEFAAQALAVRAAPRPPFPRCSPCFGSVRGLRLRRQTAGGRAGAGRRLSSLHRGTQVRSPRENRLVR